MTTPATLDYPIRRIGGRGDTAELAELQLLRFAARNGALVDPETIKVSDRAVRIGNDFHFTAEARCVTLDVPRLSGANGGYVRQLLHPGGWPGRFSRAERSVLASTAYRQENA